MNTNLNLKALKGVILCSNNNLTICLHPFCRTRSTEHPSQASVLDPLMLLSPAFSNGANSTAMNGNFPVPYNLQRQRSNTMTSAPPSSLIQPFNLQRPRSNTMSSVPSSSLGQQDQSRVDSVIQQEMLQKLLQKLRQH